MPDVTVVVPNWNRRDLLKRLIDSLREQTYPPAEIIVIDNGSRDGSPEAAREKGARVIALERNEGFAAAVNRGISAAGTEWIAIVNNDVSPARDWLEQLAAALEHSGAWFATPKLVHAADSSRLDGTFDLLCRGACAWRAGHGRSDGVAWTEPRPIWIAPFTAALFRAELFRRVGPLDERFESYLEDADFGIRCAQQGYIGVYAPLASARHMGSATLGRWHADTVRRIARNQILLVAKHYSRRDLLRFVWPILVAQLLWGAVAIRHRRGLAYIAGKLQGLGEFAEFRRELRRSGDGGRALARILAESESDILDLQRKTGFDAYWRAYFALTRLR